MYLFLGSFILMQLIEFFIWKNINNEYYNNIYSIFATLLLIMQPIFSIMIIKNIQLRNLLLKSYLLLAVPYSIYKFSTNHIHSTISESGHLRWKFFNTTAIIWIVWLFFFLISFIYEKKYFGPAFGLIMLIISFINYKNDHTMWSMWCGVLIQ